MYTRYLNNRLCVLVFVFGSAIFTARAGQAETTVIRTFTNGVTADNSTQTVRDLHIEYDTDLNGKGFLGRQELVADIQIDGANSKRLDVTFTRDLEPGESVTIVAITSANELNISKWWWTDGDHDPVKKTFTYSHRRGERTGEITEYPGWLRGDEAGDELLQGKDDLRRRRKHLDPYAIVNKAHHWGGTTRQQQKITLTMNIRSLVQNRPSGMDADKLKDNVAKAIKQWTDCTSSRQNLQVPRAGQAQNPANHGSGNDPANMAPGPSHQGGKGIKFRSVTDRECNATLVKYPRGLEITVVEEGDDGDVVVGWNPRNMPEKALGWGPSEAPSNDRARTTKGTIGMRKSRSTKWHLAEDTDGDGYITNQDSGDVPEEEYDFYSVFKHELGHVLCFNHAGENHFEEDARFLPGEPLGPPINQDGDQSRSPYPSGNGDTEFGEPQWYFFASDRPGGEGGFDIWIAEFQENDRWQLSNPGPAINSAQDDLDPFLASDGTTLLFASNRGGRSQSLYRSIFDLGKSVWRTAQALDLGDPTADHRHPSLPADMRTLYFSSDAPGGHGGEDIWSAEWIEHLGAFSSPVNLGGAVNQASNEQAPAISGDGKMLYFASDRVGGVGGFDLWATARAGGWGPPFHLGSVINSDFDELDPGIRLDDKMLLYASNRSNPSTFEVFEAQLDPTPITPPGDVNGDSVVDALDAEPFLALFRDALGRCLGEQAFTFDLDLNDDACVTFEDYQVFQSLIDPAAPPPAGAVSSVWAVPSALSATLGEVIVVEFRADLPDPVIGFGFELDFDPGVLMFRTVSVGSAWLAPSAPLIGDEMTGIAAMPVAGADILLARVEFVVLAEAPSAISLQRLDDGTRNGFPLVDPVTPGRFGEVDLSRAITLFNPTAPVPVPISPLALWLLAAILVVVGWWILGR